MRILLYVMGVALCLLACNAEPTYKGRTLSQWLAAYDKADEGSAEEQQAVAAIHSMGTNAIPYLTRWITNEHWETQMPAANAFKHE
jgi:hypothetical protein